MPHEKSIATDAPAELAKRITEVLLRERVVPRFVDSYVVENGRHALQVHASLYRDLLALLQREALLALAVRALAIDRKSTRLNSSHSQISYAVFCLKKKKK